MAYRTWADEGYVPRYRFVRPVGSEGLYNEGILDVTNVPEEPDWGYSTPSFGTYPGGIQVNQYHPLWNDPTFLYDLMRWEQAATGQPGSGWAQGDNAGDGYGLGSLLSNEFVLAALATGIAGGAAALGGAAPATASGAIPAGAEGLTASTIGVSGTGAGTGAGTASGLFGTGITAKQALAGAQLAAGLGGLAAGGGSGGGGSGASGNGGTTASQAALNANNIFAGNLALASIPPRLAHLQEGLNATTTLANASPMALTQRLAPQIEEARAALQKMFQQSSQRFGPLGGGQTQREQVGGTQAIGGKLSQMATQIPDQARTALRALIENFQTTPQPATSILQTGTQPFDTASLLAALKQGAELGKVGNRVDQWLSQPSSSSWNRVWGIN